MKRKYIPPTTTAITLFTEGALLKTSMTKNNDSSETTSASDALTGRYSWDSQNWTENDD